MQLVTTEQWKIWKKTFVKSQTLKEDICAAFSFTQKSAKNNNHKLCVCCKLSRNQSTGGYFLLFEMIQTCSIFKYLVSTK